MRVLAVVLLFALMTVGLPAAASVCEKPPSSNCTAAAPCSISVKWFKDNQHCTKPSAHHADISVGKNGMLIVTAHASVGNFTVLGFKRHPMPGGVCDWHKIQSYAKPFKVSPGGSAPAHTLTATAGSDGCYTVNFKAGATMIDPHIIVSGN